jgi:hypothetical protein
MERPRLAAILLDSRTTGGPQELSVLQGATAMAHRVMAVLALFLLASGAAWCGDAYTCRFVAGQWQAADWTLVKSPRLDRLGEWVQETESICNQTPAGAAAADLRGKSEPEAYSSMVVARPFEGNLSVRTTFSFDDQMAPLIVLAPELGKDAKERTEYRELFEIVAYNKGINVWHHTWADGKQSYKKAAYWNFELKPETRYVLEVQVNHSTQGPMLVVKLDDREMGYLDAALPTKCYVGITGCEGLNHFYDFSVRSE